jgi:hypothetical protein
MIEQKRITARFIMISFPGHHKVPARSFYLPSSSRGLIRHTPVIHKFTAYLRASAAPISKAF